MKIVLIEDRVVRKENFLRSLKVNFDSYSFLKILSPEEYKEMKLKINFGDKFIFDDVDLIMTHKSAFTISEQDYINFCGKPIVYFSGGISQSFLSTIPTPILHVNQSDFYSENLIEFLNHIVLYNIIELPILQLGTRWKLGILLRARDEFVQINRRFFNKEIFPEDLVTIFNKQFISIVVSSELIGNVQSVLEDGLAHDEVELRERLVSQLKQEINHQLSIIS